MKITNQKIYEYATKLAVFNNCNVKMPVRINFHLQKNIQLIQQAAEEIEKTRLNLLQQYGVLNDEQNGYNIPEENIMIINSELSDLLLIEQDLPIHIFKLDNFDGIDLDFQKMSAIIFMIEE